MERDGAPGASCPGNSIGIPRVLPSSTADRAEEGFGFSFARCVREISRG